MLDVGGRAIFVVTKLARKGADCDGGVNISTVKVRAAIQANQMLWAIGGTRTRFGEMVRSVCTAELFDV